MSYLQNILAICQDNLGGISRTLQVASVNDIDTFPEIINFQITDPIVFKAGRGFLTWEVTQDSDSFSSKDADSEAGHSKKNTIPFVVPKDRPDIYAILMKAQDDAFVVLYTDSNGTQRLIGTLDAPALFKFDFDTGKQVSNFNNYKAEFYTDSPFNTNYYTPGGTPQPGTAAPAIVEMENGTVLAVLQPGQTFTITTPYAIGYNISG